MHGLHDRGKLGNRAAAEVVAVREAAGQDNRIHAAQRFLLVPKKFSLVAEILRHGVESVVIAIAARKDHHTEAHNDYFSVTK